MNARTTLFLVLLQAVGLWLAAGLVPALADEQDSQALTPNIRITLTIGDTEPAAGFRERHYRTVARTRTPTELLMGWRTPIPSKRQEVTVDGETPITAYTYQNVGVTGQFELELVEGRILTRLSVEVSGPKEGAGEASRAGAPPVIGTFQQRVLVLLEDGKPLRIAEVPDHEGGSLYLEVTAEILD